MKDPIGQKVTEALAEGMVKEGLITSAQLAIARVSQESLGKELGRILIEKGFLTEVQLLSFLGKTLSTPYISLADVTIDPELVKTVPLHMAQRYRLIPIAREGDKVIVAMSDPKNLFALEDVRGVLRKEVKPVLSSVDEINQKIKQYYGVHAPTADRTHDSMELVNLAPEGPDEGAGMAGDKLEKIATGPKVVSAVNEIILGAFKEKASDIHLEPTREGVRVRYRIDGCLDEKERLPREMLLPVVSRIKIIGGMDIAERRVPQDGRVRVRIGGTSLDMRLSTYPTLYGEKVVMRLLAKDSDIGIESMGFSNRDRKTFADLIMRSHGIFLVTGPTGSGKSTTLYAALSRINTPDKNIISIEDPVESEIPGVNQAQVNAKAGVTFASALRSILRQDPDVIMIGEIRDGETAQIAVRAAITGHLVLSTLHTNTAAGAVARLTDLGTEPFLIASSLIGVLAQRLVRKICNACRKEIEPDPTKIWPLALVRPETVVPQVGYKSGKSALEVMDADDTLPPTSRIERSYMGRGCVACRMSGYSGRIGIFEMAPIGESVRALIAAGASEHDIEKELRKMEVRAILEDGLDKVNAGITTVEEVLRVTQEE